MEDSANYQQSEMQSETPRLCARGCSFFGSPATHNLCSKCYGDYLKEESKSSAPADSWIAAAANSDRDQKNGVVSKKNRCLSCNKKVGLLGFTCRCGGTFCAVHRYPEKHDCQVDYKSEGRVALGHQNPLVKADKMEDRI